MQFDSLRGVQRHVGIGGLEHHAIFGARERFDRHCDDVEHDWRPGSSETRLMTASAECCNLLSRDACEDL